MDHHGVVLAQRWIAAKSNQIPSFQLLLDTIDLKDAVLTGYAVHTQHCHGAYLRQDVAHYLADIKKNHPGRYSEARRLPWTDIPLDHFSRDRTHHRGVSRTSCTTSGTGTFREDNSKLRTGTPFRTMVSLLNLAISVFRQNDETNIAAVLRRTSRDCG